MKNGGLGITPVYITYKIRHAKKHLQQILSSTDEFPVSEKRKMGK